MLALRVALVLLSCRAQPPSLPACESVTVLALPGDLGFGNHLQSIQLAAREAARCGLPLQLEPRTWSRASARASRASARRSSRGSTRARRTRSTSSRGARTRARRRVHGTILTRNDRRTRHSTKRFWRADTSTQRFWNCMRANASMERFLRANPCARPIRRDNSCARTWAHALRRNAYRAQLLGTFTKHASCARMRARRRSDGKLFAQQPSPERQPNYS